MEMSTSLTHLPGTQAQGQRVASTWPGPWPFRPGVWNSRAEPRLTCRGSLLRLWVHLGSSGLEGERLCSLLFLQLP